MKRSTTLFFAAAIAALALVWALTPEGQAQQSSRGFNTTGATLDSPTLNNATLNNPTLNNVSMENAFYLNVENAWGGPTNSLTMTAPYLTLRYTVTSDVSFTNISGQSAGYREGNSLVLTNGTTSNCVIRWPSHWKKYGTALSAGTATITNGGKMLKLEIETNGTGYTNILGAFEQ